MKILIVEDDPLVAQSLNHLFSSCSYAVDIASDGDVGLEMVEAFNFDLIVLDIGLPCVDGLTLCQQVRAQNRKVPILLLTGQGGDGHQQAVALNAGADDYVVKPFDSEELIARVQALLRRTGTQQQSLLTWGDLTVEPSRQRVTYSKQVLSLTPKEYSLLLLMMRTPQKLFSARTILDHAWAATECPGEEVVRYHIKELRQKLRAAKAPKDLIQTLHGMGYRLNPIYSSFSANQVEQNPDPPQVAELIAVNQQLRYALEKLKRLEEELQQKNESLLKARQDLELEKQHYQDLFEFAPEAYLVTDCHGTIIEANQKAADMFGVKQATFLRGKPLMTYVSPADHQKYCIQLSQLDHLKNWELTLQADRDKEFLALITVMPKTSDQGAITGLHWLFRNISQS